MAEYRYVVFPRGKQPTVEEIRELNLLAGIVGNKLAWGRVRDDGRLALACAGAEFDEARHSRADFDGLMSTWELRGCEIVAHLGFVKDASALRPVPTGCGAPHQGDASLVTMRNQEQHSASLMRAREALARSLLGVERKLDRFAALQRFAAAAPYLMVLAGAIVTISMGAYVRNRMLNSDRESRQHTIQRVVSDPLGESLDPRVTTGK